MTAGLSLSYRHDRQNNKNPKMTQRPLIKRVLRFIEECVTKKQHNVTQLGLYFYTCNNQTKSIAKQQNKTAAWSYIKQKRSSQNTAPFDLALHK